MPELHMLRDVGPHRAWLSGTDLAGRGVVEFGVGTGVLTRLILERNPARVVGYEIDPDLCRLADPRFELPGRPARWTTPSSLTRRGA